MSPQKVKAIPAGAISLKKIPAELKNPEHNFCGRLLNLF
jgi:hypothetical protein